MAEYAYPMDSKVTYDGNGIPSFDRAVTSAQLRGMISEIITNGVLMANNSNALRVVANGDDTVTVQPGLCVINGAIKKFTEPYIFPLGILVDFKDNNFRGIAICAVLDFISRDVRLEYYKYGAKSATDLIPLNRLDRENNRYAIQLANIYIAPGSTRIVQSDITDTRLNTQRCGAVSCIGQFDTTNLYNQIQSDLASFKSTEQAEFRKWFENLQTVLDSNTAAHLQNEIDKLSSSKANKSDITNISITGTTNNTGAAILAGARFYLNGMLYTAKQNIPNAATFTTSNCEQVPMHNGKVYIKLHTGNVPSTTDFSVVLSVTIPANCEFALYGIGFYNNSVCTGAKFRENYPDTNYAETASTGNRVSISGVVYTDTTFYLLTKYDNTYLNDKQIYGWYKHIDYNVEWQ